jgi:hypothetical protein
MGFRVHCGFVLLVALVLAAWAEPRGLAQSTHGQSSYAKVGPRVPEVRSQDQGLAVLGAALESRRHLPRADCSHLVHAVYQQAGLPYSYVPSRALYAGAAPFKRVAHPLPGDLIVWPGHVGIVINPRNHSFYSSFSSGPGVENYDSKYWRRRGKRRFFRYVKSNVVVRDAPLAATKSAKSTSSEVFPSATGDHNPRVESDPASSGPESALPLRIAVVRSSRPTTDEVRAAVLQSFQQTEDGLRGQNVFKLARAVVVFDKFQVHKVHIKKGHQSWVEVRISEPTSLIAGRVNSKKRSEKLRWSLTQTGTSSWQVQLPPDAIYVAQQTAPRVLSHQLATLTERSDANSLAEQSQLAQALAVILK